MRLVARRSKQLPIVEVACSQAACVRATAVLGPVHPPADCTLSTVSASGWSYVRSARRGWLVCSSVSQQAIAVRDESLAWQAAEPQDGLDVQVISGHVQITKILQRLKARHRQLTRGIVPRRHRGTKAR